MMNNELYHYGVKGMKWGVRRERELADKMHNSGQARTKYSYEKAASEKRKIRDKEDWREYSRELYKRDAVYKKLYDQYEKDRTEYTKLINDPTWRKAVGAGRSSANKTLASQGNVPISQVLAAGGVMVGLAAAAGVVSGLYGRYH